MQALCTFCVLSTLAVTLVAQSKIISSPPGFEAKDSGGLPNSFASSFGWYFDYHYQFADGTMRGRKMSITRIGYRLAYLMHTANTAMGRSWTRVTLQASTCELDKLTTDFAQNSLTTPNTVFDGAVTWPTATGYPGTRPAPWDNRLSFPFQAPWNYDGDQDILLDYEFNGGALANQVTNPRGYFLDTIRSVSTACSTGHRSHYRTSTRHTARTLLTLSQDGMRQPLCGERSTTTRLAASLPITAR